MRAIDTNVLVRVLTRDDLQQTTAAESFVENGAWISVLVLAETMWVLRTAYAMGSDQLTRAAEMLLDHRNYVLQDADLVAAALELFRTKPTLAFSDCLILELARKAGNLPLGTFDRKLARVEGAQRL